MFESPKELESMVLTGTKILVEALESDNKTSGGIILHSWSQSNHKKGQVVLTGPGTLTKQKTYVTLGVDAGDTILYKNGEGVEVSINGKKFIMFMDETSIVGKINKHGL